MSEKLIYLASPYSNPNPAVSERRFIAVCHYAADLMRAGYMVFSPIAHTHPIAKYGLPKDWAFWSRCDRVLLERCDELWVVQMDGWDTSIGVQAEIAIAKELGKPVLYLEVNEHGLLRMPERTSDDHAVDQ